MTRLCALALPMLLMASPVMAEQPMFMDAKTLKWEKVNTAAGDRSPQYAMLYTNPTTKASQLLIWVPADTHVPKHWHSAAETVVVIRGNLVLGHEGGGDRTEIKVGSFAMMPAKMVHEGWTKDQEALLLITTDGAWDINWKQ